MEVLTVTKKITHNPNPRDAWRALVNARHVRNHIRFRTPRVADLDAPQRSLLNQLRTQASGQGAGALAALADQHLAEAEDTYAALQVSCIDKNCGSRSIDPEGKGWEHVAPDAWLCLKDHDEDDDEDRDACEACGGEGVVEFAPDDDVSLLAGVAPGESYSEPCRACGGETEALVDGTEQLTDTELLLLTVRYLRALDVGADEREVHRALERACDNRSMIVTEAIRWARSYLRSLTDRAVGL